MFIFTTAIAGLLLIPQGSLAEITSTYQYPQLVAVQPVPNTDNALSYSFTFPIPPQYDHIDANYTLYEFNDANKANPQPYSSQISSCSVSVPCSSSTVPQVTLSPGTFVIGCFQWTLWGVNNENLGTSYNCILGRTTVNLTELPALGLMIDPPIANYNNVCIVAYYPAALPYDVINLTSTLNGTILPTTVNASSNDTYSMMGMFIFDNLRSNTNYNVCIILDYANSVIRGSGKTETYCKSVNTLADSTTTPMTTSTIPTTTTTTTTKMTTTTVSHSSTTMLLSNFTLLIFFFLLVVL